MDPPRDCLGEMWLHGGVRFYLNQVTYIGDPDVIFYPNQVTYIGDPDVSFYPNKVAYIDFSPYPHCRQFHTLPFESVTSS